MKNLVIDIEEVEKRIKKLRDSSLPIRQAETEFHQWSITWDLLELQLKQIKRAVNH